jgi:hypothetical protein
MGESPIDPLSIYILDLIYICKQVHACTYNQIGAICDILLQTHINFPRFLPIFPDILERLSHLAPIYLPLSPETTKYTSPLTV